MSTLDKITTVLNSKGKTQKDLCDFLGIHRNVYTLWKSGRNASYKKYLYAIASFLDVPVSYLIGETDETGKPSEQDDESSVLDETDASILAELKKVSAEQKKQILSYIRFLLSEK